MLEIMLREERAKSVKEKLDREERKAWDQEERRRNAMNEVIDLHYDRFLYLDRDDTNIEI